MVGEIPGTEKPDEVILLSGHLVAEGVPGLGMNHAATHYFDIHHTEADTLDKVDENDLAQNAAILGTFAYALAQSWVTFR